MFLQAVVSMGSRKDAHIVWKFNAKRVASVAEKCWIHVPDVLMKM